MRALVVALVVLAARPAAADPRWWQSFYATAGYRAVVGVDNASRASFCAGYRYEHGKWGLDAALANLQYGLDEGLHTLARLTGVRELGRGAWAGAGVSYGWTKGWIESVLPKRVGEGPQIDVTAGLELEEGAAIRPFLQVDLTLPLYRLYDVYRSTDSARYAVGVEVAAGVRF